MGGTGRPLTASANVSVAYFRLVCSAVRPFAEIIPDSYHLILEIAAGAWLLAFALFLAEYGSILVTKRRARS